MREAVKVISAATELSGDVDKAIYWYRNEPTADYAHRTVAELVADGEVGGSRVRSQSREWRARAKSPVRVPTKSFNVI
nr:hypothetical protein [Mesorhizobium kowhaii]